MPDSVTPPPPSLRAPSAWGSRRAWVVLLASTMLGLAADLVSKHLAFARVAGYPVVVERAQVLATQNPGDLIPAHEPVRVVPGWLDFTLVLNPGAVFGIGAGQRVVFIVFTLAALAFTLVLFRSWTTPREHVAHVALGLLASGGLGNLYDRLVFGCVRDFIHPLPGRQWPGQWQPPWGGREIWPYVSNIADLALIIGVGVLVWKGLREPKPGAKPGAKPGPLTPPSA